MKVYVSSSAFLINEIIFGRIVIWNVCINSYMIECEDNDDNNNNHNSNSNKNNNEKNNNKNNINNANKKS